MKKTNKKGFTIVELIIVIATIAVLAAVLIPTFANIINRANDSAYQQERTNQMIQDAIEKIEKGNDNYMSWEDLEEAIAKALKENALTADSIIEIVGVGKDTGLTNEQLTAILEAIANKKFSDTQVRIILDGVKSGETSITKEQIDQIIAKLPQVGITQEAITAAVNEVIKDESLAGKINDAITAAIENIPTLSKEDIATIVERIFKSITEEQEHNYVISCEYYDDNNGFTTLYFTSLEEALAASKASEDSGDGFLELHLLCDLEVNTIFALAEVGNTYASEIYLDEHTLSGNLFLNGTTLSLYDGTVTANIYLNDTTKSSITQNCALNLGTEWEDDNGTYNPVTATGTITLNGSESSLTINSGSSAPNITNNGGLVVNN